MKDRQLRKPSKKDVPQDKHLPASDMNVRATGGDKESHEPLRPKMKGSEPPAQKRGSR